MRIRPPLAPASCLLLTLAALAAPLIRGPEAAPRAGSAAGEPGVRRPVALAIVDGGKLLFVANRRSGSVSVIDTEKARAVAEASVGRGLADLAATPDGRWLLAVDEEAHELILLGREGRKLRVAGRRKMPTRPVTVRITPEGDRCFVASSWARQLSVLDLADPSKPSVRATVDLPFAPRLQLFLPKARRLLVADSHGGQVAVVDPARGKVESLRSLPGHNIRGLATRPCGQTEQ
jgi:YVTN family beta-propeller protein